MDLKNNFNTFLFDFDLTIADGSQWILECYQNILHKNGFNNITDKKILRTIGMTVESSFEEMTNIHNLSELTYLQKQFRALCRPKMAANTKIYPDALVFIKELHKAKKQLCIVSTKQKLVIIPTLKQYGIIDYFDLLIGRNEVTEAKPSPQGINYAIKELKADKKESIYFGDSIIDAQAAQRANIGFIGITKGQYKKEELEKYPHIDIKNHF